MLQHDEEDELRGGARVTLSRYIAADWGGTFLLGEFSTVQNTFFLLAQFGFAASGLGVEFTAGGSDDDYRERALALTYRFPGTPFSLRLGRRFEEGEVFAGVSINTF